MPGAGVALGAGEVEDGVSIAPGAGAAGAEGAAGLTGAGAVEDGVVLDGPGDVFVSLSQAVRATAITDATIKVLLIMLRLL